MSFRAPNLPARSALICPPTTSLTGPLRDVNLRQAQLTDIHLERAEITNADFTGACFGLGNIEDALFVDCDFTDTTFLCTRLSNVHFIRCDLIGTAFTASSLRTLTTQDCDLTHSVLYDSYVDQDTLLPRGYTRSTAPLTDSPDLARIYVDTHALREEAERVGLDHDAAIDLFIEHRDLAPRNLFALFAALKASL